MLAAFAASRRAKWGAESRSVGRSVGRSVASTVTRRAGTLRNAVPAPQQTTAIQQIYLRTRRKISSTNLESSIVRRALLSSSAPPLALQALAPSAAPSALRCSSNAVHAPPPFASHNTATLAYACRFVQMRCSIAPRNCHARTDPLTSVAASRRRSTTCILPTARASRFA
jgi:hypothetical protein